jgi:hypothetical protein
VTDDRATKLLCRAAAAAESRPGFLAAILARYRDAEGLTDFALASRLGLSSDRLCALALCRRPRESAFREDVETIAARFDIEPAALAAVIRHVDALDARSRGMATSGKLMSSAKDAKVDAP